MDANYPQSESARQPAVTDEQKSQAELILEIRALRGQLEEAEAMLDAMRGGRVDLVFPDHLDRSALARRDADDLYQVLIEGMSEGAMLMGRNGAILYCNHRFAGLLQAPLEQVIGSSMYLWVMPEEQPRLKAYLEKDPLNQWQGEILLKTHGAGRLPAAFAANPIASPDLALSGWILSDRSEQKKHAAQLNRMLEEAQMARRSLLSLLEDQQKAAQQLREREVDLLSVITAQKETEKALKSSEQRYRVLMESLDSAVSLVDKNGVFLYTNQIAARILGVAPERITGVSHQDIFSREEVAFQTSMVEKTLRENKTVKYEESLFRQGQQHWYQTTLTPIEDEQGRPYAILVNAVDITDMKNLQAELQLLNRELESRVEKRTAEVRELYENAPAGYHSLDSQGLYLAVNQTELNWLGYTAQELIGQPFSSLLTQKGLEVFQDNFSRFKQVGRVENLEYELRCKDGHSIFGLVNAEANYDASGNFVSTRSSMVNITERKRAEDALTVANLDLEKAMRVKDEFLASMSHELRTPMTGILGLSEAFQLDVYGELSPKQRKMMSQIEASGQHLLELINDVLDLSKFQADRLELDQSIVSAGEICQASLQLVKGLARQNGIQVYFDMTPEAFMLVADGRRLKQMLVNLLSNAVKFTPENHSIGLSVRASETEHMAYFTVWDTGIGIEPEAIAKLFKPFVQLDSKLNRRYTGSGLGLALVKSMAVLHGGEVGVESVLGTGSRFTISLPWQTSLPEAQLSRASASAEVRPNSALEKTALSKTLLIVDDTEDILIFFQDFFQFLGYQVKTAHSGIEGLNMLNRTQPDLILLDVQMPDIDGLELAGLIRAYPSYRHIPIIALTALAMPGDRERCLAAGMNEYVSKPLNLQSLAELIQQFLTAAE